MVKEIKFKTCYVDEMKAIEYITIFVVIFLVYGFVTRSFFSVAKLQEEMKAGRAVVIDVREKDEIEQGMLKDALWLPLSKLRSEDVSQELQKLKEKYPSKTFYLYCRSGNRSGISKSIFEKHGLPTENIGGFNSLSRILPIK
ncbi:rhodanese-like domain-containing protein [Bacteriovorax sp. Seq25_V]|uniref:rhodanese-like domain-containing protein n=1 Tax=Bacteriovorax sp. Seq25_V TaxID=1201288 RepID=UPI000389FD99|nr:rhodanese-like domain-containing protein [Bacteriovorax sp. Seq25_V]EQC47530.1 rhodanese-like protein [Bacteriovorax sp. Seq25_V]